MKNVMKTLTGVLIGSMGVSAALADIKVRLKSSNNFVIEDRNNSANKNLTVKLGGGVDVPRGNLTFAAVADSTGVVTKAEVGTTTNQTDTKVPTVAAMMQAIEDNGGGASAGIGDIGQLWKVADVTVASPEPENYDRAWGEARNDGDSILCSTTANSCTLKVAGTYQVISSAVTKGGTTHRCQLDMYLNGNEAYTDASADNGYAGGAVVGVYTTGVAVALMKASAEDVLTWKSKSLRDDCHTSSRVNIVRIK